MKTRIRLGLAAAAVMLSAAFIGMNVKTPAVRAEVATAAAPAASVAGVPRDTASYADLVSRVSPSVVTVRSQRMVRAASQQFDIPEELRPFFGDGQGSGPSAPRRQGALGSGVIVIGRRLHPHQPSRGRRRAEDQRRSLRPSHAHRPARRLRCAQRPRGPQDRREGPAGAAAGRLRRSRAWATSCSRSATRSASARR